MSDPNQGIGYTLASISAVTLGGASLFGGRGAFIGVLFGAVLIQEISSVTTFLILSVLAVLVYQYHHADRRRNLLPGASCA